jgi:asparagine synthetase B (glutamine-hydrolysing)
MIIKNFNKSASFQLIRHSFYTRLAIIDLSDHGRQPLHTFDKKLHLFMNDELYDHDRIR